MNKIILIHFLACSRFCMRAIAPLMRCCAVPFSRLFFRGSQNPVFSERLRATSGMLAGAWVLGVKTVPAVPYEQMLTGQY